MEDDPSESFNVKLWHFYEACFRNGQMQHTPNRINRGRFVWLYNKFLYTAHFKLQIKHTDRF